MNGQPYREAGLASHPDVREVAVDWQHTIFATADPLAYLHLQLQQFEHSNHPLPLVLWQDTHVDRVHAYTRRAWEMFGGCRVVFWDPFLGLSTLKQAIAIDGWIATCGPRPIHEKTEIRDYLEYQQPSLFCSLLQRQARPWPKALAKALSTWSDSRVEDIFLQLRLESPQLEKVRKACPFELRKRLDSILASRPIQRFVRFDDHVVVEQPDGWYCYRHRDWARRHMELICNAWLRVLQIVTHKRTGRATYVGTIIYNGEEIPFVAAQKEIEKDPLGWMRQFLLQCGKGLLRYNPAWSKKIISVAASFQDPKVVAGIDTVGWDQERAAFLLPGRIIGLDGTHKLPLIEDASLFPAANLKCSSEPLPTNWHELENEYELSLFWGALTGVLSDVLAPALFRETKGIGLVGKGAEAIGLAVAQEAGCLLREVRSVPTAKQAAEKEQRHRWPLCRRWQRMRPRPPCASGSTATGSMQEIALRRWTLGPPPRRREAPRGIC